MNERGFVKNIVIIIVILTIVFLGQQPYFKEIGKNFYFQNEAKVKTYWQKTADWFKNNIYQRVSGEVDQKTNLVQKEINKQKDNIVQNVWEKIKNYLGNIFSKVSGTNVK